VLGRAAPARRRAGRARTLNIKVVKANNKSKAVDPRLEKLVKEWKLSFTAYELADEAVLDLDIGSVGACSSQGRVDERPRQEMVADGKLKVELTIEKLKFKATVLIAAGATLAVGGPAINDGALILALTRPKSG